VRVFYSVTDDTASFIRARDACRDGRIWLAVYSAKTWRDFIAALPEEYQDFFDDRFEDDSDLDQPFDPELVISSYEGYFPPGLPDGLVRQWMPREIIERFGDPGYDQNVSFGSAHTEEILTILRREGYECIDASLLVSMLSFGGRADDFETIEKLLDTTERELGIVRRESRPRRIRFDPHTGICSHDEGDYLWKH
jgi:hypothetical protein